MSKEQALEELLKMIKEGNITDYDAELASYRDEKYGYKDIDENTQRVNTVSYTHLTLPTTSRV